MRKLFTLAVTMLLLCSCAKHVTEENTGKIVTPSDLEHVSEEREKLNVTYLSNIDHSAPKYYWTENGSVFHSSENCSSLANSKTVICGNISHAINQNITNTCSRCFEKSD